MEQLEPNDLLTFARVADARSFGRAAGRLRVAMPSDLAILVLADPLAAFIALHPAVSLELDLSARRVDLLGENVDVAVPIGTPPGERLSPPRRVGAFPIGVDFNAFLRQAATPQVATTNSRYASVSRHAYARRRRTSAAMRALVKPPQMQICLMAWWMVSSLHRLLQVAGGSLIAGPGLCIQDLEVGEYSRLSSPQQRLRWF